MCTKDRLRGSGLYAAIAVWAGACALMGCLPEDWEQHAKSPPIPPKRTPPAQVANPRTPPATLLVQPMQITKFTPAQFPAKAGFPPGKVTADELRKAVPQVTNIQVSPYGSRIGAPPDEAYRFRFTVAFSQPISLASLSAPLATRIVATCPGKPPGQRDFPLTGTFGPVGSDQKTVLFTSQQVVTNLTRAAGWQTPQEIAKMRNTFSVYVALYGTPQKPGGPVVAGATGTPLDGNSDGQPGGVFSRTLSYAYLFP